MTIGERIKNRRMELGLTADALAKALKKNRATIYRYESNDIIKLPTTVLEPLAKALRTTPAYLMGWETEKEHKKEDAISDIFIRLREDSTFLKATEMLYELNNNQLEGVIAMLSTFK